MVYIIYDSDREFACALHVYVYVCARAFKCV